MLRRSLIASLAFVAAALMVGAAALAEQPTAKKNNDTSGVRLPAVQKVTDAAKKMDKSFSKPTRNRKPR